jgi:hypothetical protein
MKELHFNDPLGMPSSGLSPEQVLAMSISLAGTPGADYVERRCITVDVAESAGVRFVEDFAGRPAVIVALHDNENNLTSIHGRYLQSTRGQNKMLTVGPGNGVISILDGLEADPLILVEGLFDALSLATCGWPSVAMIGRWADWLPDFTNNRNVYLAFDGCRPGDADAEKYKRLLPDALITRMKPPPRCKDWNTALQKRGKNEVTRWLEQQIKSEQ